MPLMVAHSSQRILWASDQWFLFDDSYIITWTRYNWWDGDDVLFVLEQHISWIFIVLADWNNTCRSTWTHYSDYEPPSLYLDTLFWLWATQPLLGHIILIMSHPVSTWTHYSDYEPPSLYLDTLFWLWATQSLLGHIRLIMSHPVYALIL
jgi:hypothetical protein